jgi:hypothetical protein
MKAINNKNQTIIFIVGMFLIIGCLFYNIVRTQHEHEEFQIAAANADSIESAKIEQENDRNRIYYQRISDSIEKAFKAKTKHWTKKQWKKYNYEQARQELKDKIEFNKKLEEAEKRRHQNEYDSDGEEFDLDF